MPKNNLNKKPTVDSVFAEWTRYCANQGERDLSMLIFIALNSSDEYYIRKYGRKRGTVGRGGSL